MTLQHPTAEVTQGRPADLNSEHASSRRALRVLLINPPFQRLKGVSNVYFPLGLGYLAGSLKQAGFVCGIYNAENPQIGEVTPHNHLSLLEQHYRYIQGLSDASHPVWQEVRRTVEAFQPDVVGLSVMTPCYGSAVRIGRVVRAVLPRIPIVWGGAHATVQAKEILRDESEVNYVVIGEGERAMVDLCCAISEGRSDPDDIAGIAWRGAGGPQVNPPGEYVRDLDALPFPDRSASLDLEPYLRDPERAALGNLFASRGCPFRCTYCSSQTIWSRKVRSRSPENVLEEMRQLREQFGVERFSFLDDTFTMNRKWATSLCDSIIRRRMGVRWGCYTRLDVLDEDLLTKMRAAGLAELDVGVESGSPRMLEMLKKDINLGRARQMAGILNRRHVPWNAFIMMGLPDETAEDIQMTVDFVREVRPLRCILSVFTPYPGAELFDLCKQRGWIDDKPDWSRFSHHSPENHFARAIPKDQFDVLVRQVFVLIDQYNNSWSTNYRTMRANLHLYLRNPARFVQKVAAAIGRKIHTRSRTTAASAELARVSGRGAGV